MSIRAKNRNHEGPLGLFGAKFYVSTYEESTLLVLLRSGIGRYVTLCVHSRLSIALRC